MTDAKKKPWLKWYPRDDRADPLLRSVSRSARSLWHDMLGLMHESTLVGYLLLNGKKPTPEQLARVLGDSLQDLSTWLDELAAAGVYSETEDGIVYSRRMVSDHERAEKGRADVALRWGPKQKTSENTQRDPSADPNRVPSSVSITQRPEAREQSKNTVGTKVPTGPDLAEDQGFEEFWKAYPRTPNMSKQEARKAWAKLGKEGALPEGPKVLQAVEAYKRFLLEQSKGRREPHPAAHAVTWLNQRRFEGFLDMSVPSRGAALAAAVNTGPGWEAQFPKWSTIRSEFKRMHGNDTVWQAYFAAAHAKSETEIVCSSRFQRDTLVEKFGEKLRAIIGAPVSFIFEQQATH